MSPWETCLPPLYALAPTCARCGVRVGNLNAEVDARRQVVRFTAACHGDTEVTEVSLLDIRDGAKISAGLAFVSSQERL